MINKKKLVGRAFLLVIPALFVFAQLSYCEEVSEAEKRELAAVERFWSILERNPRRGTALDRVYGYYVDTGQIDKLLEKSTNLTETSPDDAKAWLLQGLLLARRNNDRGAVEALQKAESLDVNDAMSSFYLGELLIAQGRLRDAAEALERALERKPAKNDALAVLQTLGRVYERFGDRENSANVWEKMEETFPNDLGILVRIAETLEEEGKFEEALSRYEKLAELAKNQNYARVRFTLAAADIKIRLGNKQEAIEDFEKLLEELATDNWLAESVRDRVERVFVRQADYAGLASYYRKRLDKHPNDLNTVHRLAVALVRLSRTDEAKELLEKTLEKAPSNIKLRLALIDLLVNDKNFDEVERQYALIDELEPNNPDHISQWGLAVLENRNLDEEERQDRAANIWLRLVEARPNDMSTLVMVADLMAGKDINDEAEVLYRRAVDLAPNDSTYREYLGYFYHRSERPDKAVETLKAIAEGERHTAANLSMLSNILYGLGYLKNAMEATEEAAKLAPNDFALQLRCCELLKENEWLNEAKGQLATVQKLVETDDELEQYTRCEIELLGSRNELSAKTDELMRQADKSAKDWWRLARYLMAASRIDEATRAIDEAVRLEYPDTDMTASNEGASTEGPSTGNKNASLLILKTAAEVYAKGYDQQKAAGIYEKLAALDASMRVEHLKKLAGLQRDLGQTDKAIETARLVMATGSGNAANSKFYADMLIAIGRRNDGIEALRRAVRLDPTDTTILVALADQLGQAGQIDEAIELIWRVYDRTDDLQGKLSVITKLSTYYQMAQQFGQLIERLRQGMHDVNGRREAAYCLAQAYASVGDYHAARNSLEILLTNVDEEKTSDTFLLEQLSKVAEMQGDMNAAVRYQEMLCDLSSLAQDNDRLLGLYYATGQRDKAAAAYTQKVFEQGELVDQINAIDKMLAREDYRPALTLIERLEAKHTDHWELMYRKLQAMYWLKEGNPATIARSLAALNVEDETLSMAAEKALEQALKQSGVTSAMMRQMGYGYGGNYGNAFYGNLGQSGSWAFSSGYASSFWQFKDKNGETHNTRYLFSSEMYDMLAPEQWDAICYDLLPTLFRELLATEDRSRYYGYSSRQTNTVNEEKPQYKPISFGDAKFAAMFWRLKTAFDHDMEQLGLESPYAKTESQSTTTAEKASLNLSSNCNCGPYYSDLDLSNDDADGEDLGYDFPEKSLWETGTQPAAQSGMPTLAEPQIAEDARTTGEPTLAEPTLAEPRAANDAKGKESNAGSDFPQFNAMLEELLTTLPDDPQADVQNAEAIENRLRFEVFLGHWVTLNRDLGTVTPLKKHSTPETTARVESLATRLAFVSDDPYWKQRLFRSIFDEVSDTVLLSYYESLDLENHWGELPDDLSQNEQARASVRKLIARHVEKIRNRIAKRTTGADTVSLENKIDWLVKTYVRMSHEETSEFESQIMLYRQFCDLLRFSDREDDVMQVENAFGYAGNINPECFYRLATAPYSPFEFLPTPVGNAVMNEAPFVEFGRMQKLEQLRYWTRKGTQTLANNIKTLMHDDSLVTMPENMVAYLISPHSYRSAMMSPYGSNTLMSSFDGLFGEEQLTDLLNRELEKIWNEDLFSEVEDFVEEQGPNALSVITAALSAKSRRGLPMAPEQSSAAYDLYQVLNPSSKDEKAAVEEILTVSQDKLAAIDAWQELLKHMLDLRLEILCEIVPVRNEFVEETQLPMQTQMQLQTVRQRVSPITYAENFFNRYYDFDRDDIENILNSFQIQDQTSDDAANENEFLDSMLMSAMQQAVIADTLLGLSKPGAGVDASELQPRMQEFFEVYIAEKTASGNELEQKFAQSFTTALEKAISELAANEEQSTDDTKAIYARLQDEYREAKDNGQTWPDGKLFVLAILSSKNKNFELMIECLDAMPLTAANDIKKRESLFLTMHQQAVSNKTLRARAEQAVDKLLGYQLSTDELTLVRTLLKRFDRTEEANAIRDRLLVSATDARTQFAMLQELNRGGEKTKEQAVQYALKVFRSPTLMSPQAMQSDNINRELKNLAVTVLKKHGKLEEIVEQIEEQWKSSPGATDIMISLADIYSRNNRDEDAKRIAEEIGKLVPDDAQKMLEHAQLLRQVGMRDEAIDWTCKAIEKEPTQLFRDFWEYERTFRNAKQTSRLVELIRSMDAAVIEDNAYWVTRQLSQWLQAESTREMTLELLDSLWNNEKASPQQRENVREHLLSQMISEPRKEYLPYLTEAVLENIDVARKDEYSVWGEHKICEAADALIKAAKVDDAYDKVKSQIYETFAANETIADADRNIQAYANALLFEACLELNEKNFDRVCELLAKFFGDERFAEHKIIVPDSFVEKIADMPSVDANIPEMILEYLVTLINSDPDITMKWETSIEGKDVMVKLYFKSHHPERGKALAIDSLQQCLHYAKQCGANSQYPHVEVGDETYSIYELANNLEENVRLLKDVNCDFELWLVYQVECAGQDWYETLGQHEHMQYYASRFQEPFEGLAENITPDKMAQHIELFVPGLFEGQNDPNVANQSETPESTADDTDEPLGLMELSDVLEEMMPTDSVRLAIDCKTVNSTASGALRNAFRLLAEAAFQSEGKSLVSPLISSLLLDALKLMAVEDREKFDRVVETLDRLAIEKPEEPTFVVARLFCALAADDASVVAERLVQTADWLDGMPQEQALQFASPAYLGLWVVVRETLSDAEKYASEPVAESQERLLRKINAAKDVGHDKDAQASSGETQLMSEQVVNALNFEMQRTVPDELLEKLKTSQTD